MIKVARGSTKKAYGRKGDANYYLILYYKTIKEI